ncbi:MAG TPA: O-antigen ligase family protein [Salinivirgaceae bacterium]|nr:O-antigen ligase family protein [Salinivirgaceae bacterium]
MNNKILKDNLPLSSVSYKEVFFWIGCCFTLVLSAFLVANENYVVAALPFAMMVVAIALFSYQKLFYIIAFLAPLSIQLRFFMSAENDLSIPLEPFLVGVLLLTVYKLLFEPKIFNKKLLLHPISIVIYLNLMWLLITSATSTIPLVSFKFLLSRLWFLAAFYLMAMHLFTSKENAYRYFWFYIVSFIIVISYATYQLNLSGLFDKQAANSSVVPLLPDHTSYGAIIALLIPFIIFFLTKKDYSFGQKSLILIVLAVYIVGLIFSYTRAAWLSLGVAFAIFILLLFKIKMRTLLVIIISIGLVVFLFWDNIIMSLEKNRQDSSNDLVEQLYSMTNISTDASNLERINRWNCAIRMFQEKPILGFGPATYMFQYAPYQISSEKTIISTNFGEVGNAHSEYLGALAESGLLGALSYLLILIAITATAFKIYHRAKEREIRRLAMAIFLGLSTYFVHGFLNNFLDIDKFSLVFWGFAAFLVALDVFYLENQEFDSQNNRENHSQ